MQIAKYHEKLLLLQKRYPSIWLLVYRKESYTFESGVFL